MWDSWDSWILQRKRTPRAAFAALIAWYFRFRRNSTTWFGQVWIVSSQNSATYPSGITNKRKYFWYVTSDKRHLQFRHSDLNDVGDNVGVSEDCQDGLLSNNQIPRGTWHIDWNYSISYRHMYDTFVLTKGVIQLQFEITVIQIPAEGCKLDNSLYTARRPN